MARGIYKFVSLSSVLCLGVLVGCGSTEESLCTSAISVPSYTLRFAQGLDNFSEDQYEQLRLDSLDARETVNGVAVSADPPTEASELAIKINEFVSAMDDVDWDVTIALQSPTAVSAATELGSTETLAQANTVDAFVISQCGLPSTLAPIEGSLDTLPSPVIPSPTQTDPPASPPNDTAEELELGRTVATIFALTLAEQSMSCLGSQLAGITDVSSASANLAQYQGQFQRAFDACDINFKVPVQ